MTTASLPNAASAFPKLKTQLDESRRVLAAYADKPDDADLWQKVLVTRRTLAQSLAEVPATQKSGPHFETISDIFRAFEESGAADQPALAEDLALVEKYRKQGWPGLLAAMLLVPAWQFSSAPTLDEVQPWLWAEYTRWLFYTPKGFAAVGQASAYAAHYLKRLEELAGWGSRNRGSSAVRIALQIYMLVGNCIPLYFDTGSLRKHYELRGKIMAIGANVAPQDDLFPMPREGRRLRLGFINRHFGEQTETYTTLPTFEHLDPDRFEVVLFSHHETHSTLEEYCRQRAAEFHVLPKEIGAQVDAIRAANLDVAILGTNVTAVFNEVTHLALYRLAPLQVVNNSSCTTSGLPQVDLYVSGTATEAPDAPDHFTERLGLVPGPAHAFQYEMDRKDPVASFSRESLGLPADAVVFVSASNYFKIIPEMQHAWARLLAAVPGSRLLLHPFNPNWSSAYPIKRFCAEFDRILGQYGVANDRLIVSSNKFPSRTDVKELLSVGDIYLDSYPFGGVNSLVDPLQLGMPSIVWEGGTFRSRMGAALLRSMNLSELVAADEKGYLELARLLAGDKKRRDSLREQINLVMERGPIFLDTLAHSDAFGDLLTTAYDELVNVGREQFRKTRSPITFVKEAKPNEVLADGFSQLDAGMVLQAADCARRVLGSDPDFPKARHLLGCALLAEGKAERAVAYLLAAVQHEEGNAKLWFDLAQALRTSGRGPDAVQALETSLRIDEKNLDGWFQLLELAEQTGHTEMVAEVLQVMKQLAPDDPRIIAKAALAGIS